MKTAEERTDDIIAGEIQARDDGIVARLQATVKGGVVAANKLRAMGAPPLSAAAEAAEEAAARAAEEDAAKTAENEAAAAVLAAASTPDAAPDAGVDTDAT